MAQYRNRDFYIGLITTLDPFGSEVRIEYDDPAQEVISYQQLQAGWLSLQSGRYAKENTSINLTS